MSSKHFKNKTSVQLPDSAKSELPPREQQEIDREYTQLCISIGDRTVKSTGLEDELQQMLNYARRLGAESQRRQELNKAEADKQLDLPITDSAPAAEPAT